MPSAKRKKLTTTTSTVASSSKISAFTKVSKSKVISKSVYQKAASINASVAAEPNYNTESHKKRKLATLTEVEISNSINALSELPSSAIQRSHRVVKPLQRRERIHKQGLPKSPKRPAVRVLSPITEGTATNGAATLLDKLFLSSPAQAPTSPLQSKISSISIINSSQSTAVVKEFDGKNTNELPSELRDLTSLHSAFLTSLSLHYAHNGTHTPADLRLLCPDVARAWGKRKVVLDDIRRTIGVLNQLPVHATANNFVSAALSLSDYGHGKVCVEIKTSIGRISRPLDENRLNDTFRRNLLQLWETRDRITSHSVASFIGSLALEPISVCSSLAKMSPLLAEGQRRLENLKAGTVQMRDVQNGEKIAVTVEGEDLRLTLLERLKAKQLHMAMLAPPPSKSQISRNAALHRLEEVASVLAVLTTSTSIGQQRVSFTLPTVLGKLRDSFKNRISKEEGETCIRLLASDIAPDWLKVVKIGKVDAIVVNRDNQPSELDIQERVKSAA